jgi:hypothetical protein
MPAPKVGQEKITAAVDAVRWSAVGDDTEAALETRRRARLTGPDAVALLHYVLKTDGFASSAQRVRAAGMLLEAAGFLAPEARETGLFRPEETDGANGPGARAKS